jgi:hypothetical protein
MREYKRLYFIGLMAASLAVAGCATHTPAPVTDAGPPPPVGPHTAMVPNRVIPPPPPPPFMSRPTQRSPEMLFAALAAAGFDYRRGGKTHASGFDCSGLVAHVFREAYGLSLPHNAAAQAQRGRVIDRTELEAGDLVFFNTEKRPYSHVGIYLGDNRFIHAPKPGAVVRTENMKLAYWDKRYDGARRMVE